MHAETLILAALVGTTIAAYIDVKTTEIPDSIGVTMAIIALCAHGVHSYLTQDYGLLLQSVGSGLVFSAIGYALYRGGAWGGADAVLLGTLGVLFPPALALPLFTAAPWPATITLFFNIWAIGAAYELVYIGVLVIQKRGILGTFATQVVRQRGELAKLSIAYFGAAILVIVGVSQLIGGAMNALFLRAVIFFPAVLGAILLFKFLRLVETDLFKHHIGVSELQEGDMLAEDIVLEDAKISSRQVRGLTEEEVVSIKKEKDSVTIRSGISFAPVFPLAIILTLLVGDLVYVILTL